jgi:hypothetical protein
MAIPIWEGRAMGWSSPDPRLVRAKTGEHKFHEHDAGEDGAFEPGGDQQPAVTRFWGEDRTRDQRQCAERHEPDAGVREEKPATRRQVQPGAGG